MNEQKREIRWKTMLFLAGVSLLMVLLTLSPGEVFGSKVDWFAQHSVLPEYFRSAFYRTGELIPKFIPQLGGGQNTFQYSYYGLLNPVILISYLLPWVSMADYVMCSSILLYVASGLLFYVWMKRNGRSEKTAAAAALFFLFASPMLYHSHKQLMFVNYMPFLLMALMGVDRYFEQNKPVLMITGVFLMIMTSYFFAVGGILAVTGYGIFCFYRRQRVWDNKAFMKEGIRFAALMVIPVLMSGVLTMPSLAALAGGRSEDGGMQMNALSLLLPDPDLMPALYQTYGMGLTAVFAAAFVGLFFTGKKEHRFLAGFLAAVIFIPGIRYLLNGGLYVRGKSLIPFLPLAVYSISIFWENLDQFAGQKKFFKVLIPAGALLAVFFTFPVCFAFAADMAITAATLWYAAKKKNRNYFTVPMLVIAGCVCIGASRSDTLMKSEEMDRIYAAGRRDAVEEALENEEEPARFQDLTQDAASSNISYGPHSLRTSIYSSSYNKDYMDLYKSGFYNANRAGNAITASDSANILFETMMGVKYLVSDGAAPAGYSPAGRTDSGVLYKNDAVLPLGYARSAVMGQEEFGRLSEAEKPLAMLENVVVGQSGQEAASSRSLRPVPVDLDLMMPKDAGGNYKIHAESPFTVQLDLDMLGEQDILMLQFHVNPRDGKNVTIKANGVVNYLDVEDTIYPNGNYDFFYALSSAEGLKKLTLEFSAGSYELSGFKAWKTDYGLIRSAVSDADAFKADAKSMESGRISGQVRASADGYFTMSIPFDSGFRAWVDGVEVTPEKVNGAFLGFPITAGEHRVELEYSVPLLAFGIALSQAGLLAFLAVAAAEIVWVPAQSWRRERAGLHLGKQGRANA